MQLNQQLILENIYPFKHERYAPFLYSSLFYDDGKRTLPKKAFFSIKTRLSVRHTCQTGAPWHPYHLLRLLSMTQLRSRKKRAHFLILHSNLFKWKSNVSITILTVPRMVRRPRRLRRRFSKSDR